MFLALAAWTGLILACHLAWGWVPILDSANLAFHEAGHPLFGLLAESMAMYGGTFMQLALPAAAAFEAAREDKPAGLYFCVIWLGENLLNVARYMADARRHELPLVGGLDPEYSHDWTEILSHWDLLEHEQGLAYAVRLLALGLMTWALWSAWRTAREAAA